jgi:predicted metal-dependent phosphoesterase TrpH
MQLKTNLHLHTADDPKDWIRYSAREAIDQAATLGFEVLGLTCHGFFAWKEEYDTYAKTKNILLIPGIELALNGPTKLHGRHVVVLNCDKDIEAVRTLDDLAEYKYNNPQIFILAPHPFYPHPFEKLSLFEYLEKHIKFFDAIEWSWFYSRSMNGRNRRAEEIANIYKKPLIATSDTHFLEHLDFGYAKVTTEEKTVGAVLQAVNEGKFENVTTPRKFWREMVYDYVFRKIIFGDLINKTFGQRK